MGIAIPFGYPHRSMKPRHYLSLQLKRRIAWVSQSLSVFPVSRRSPIAIRFCVSGHYGKQNRNSFWPSGDSGKRNRNSFLAFRGSGNANRNSFLASRGLGNANRNSFLASRSLGNANRNSFFASLSLRKAKSQFILGFMDTPSMLIEDYFMLH